MNNKKYDLKKVSKVAATPAIIAKIAALKA